MHFCTHVLHCVHSNARRHCVLMPRNGVATSGFSEIRLNRTRGISAYGRRMSGSWQILAQNDSGLYSLSLWSGARTTVDYRDRGRLILWGLRWPSGGQPGLLCRVLRPLHHQSGSVFFLCVCNTCESSTLMKQLPLLCVSMNSLASCFIMVSQLHNRSQLYYFFMRSYCVLKIRGQHPVNRHTHNI